MRARQSPLNGPDRELDRFRFRVALAGVAVLVAFALLVARFFHLQVVQHAYYTTRAEDNRISLVPIVPNRGVIVDSKGVVLARNYSAFTLEITPSKVDDLDATIDGLPGDRGPAEGPQALPSTARGEQDLRKPADRMITGSFCGTSRAMRTGISRRPDLAVEGAVMHQRRIKPRLLRDWILFSPQSEPLLPDISMG